jgi:dolichol-phosphate mannosyltransferase
MGRGQQPTTNPRATGQTRDVKNIVVIPTYNEAENIASLIEALRGIMPQLEILVVDDGSPDGTGDIAEGLGARVLRRPRKLGLGTAYVTAFGKLLEEGYDRLAHMDADFSHDPAVLPKLFALLDTHDVAVGSRYVPGGGSVNWGLHRRLLSRGANMLARTILGLKPHDVTGGFRAFRREALQAMDLPSIKSEGYSFMVEMAYRAQRKGFTIGEVPIVFRDREKGTSKMSLREMRQGLINLFRIRMS